MANPSRTLKQVQLFFTGLFLISGMVYITVFLILGQPPGDHPSMLPEESIRVIEVISMLTSVVSLIALLSSTVISWMREKRANQRTRLNRRLQEIKIQREEVALERERAELNQIRTQTRAD